MLRLNRSDNTESSPKVRAISRLGMLCGMVAMLGVAGCDPCMNNPCNDGVACNGVETCTADGGSFTCTDGTPVECEFPTFCTEPDGTCVDPCDGVDCADENDCTTDTCVTNEDGTTTCNNDTACDDEDACTENDTCGDDGVCAGTALDCDDADACTDDSCADGVCANDPVECAEGEVCVDGECIVDLCDGVDCDDSDACTTDTCDPADGSCSNEAIVCENEGEVCNNGVCDVPTDCTQDSDCDDGNFCNGTETCDLTDPDNGVCANGDSPCTDDQTCDEDLNSCVDPPVSTVDFTLGLDNLNGGGGDDIFSGPLLFNSPTGTSVPSVQTGDTANGGDGTDTANMQFNFAAATTVAPTTTSIEVFNITDFGSTAATTLAGGNLTGATDFNLSGSTNTFAFVVNNLPANANLGVSQQAIGATIAFQTAATSGSSDSIGVNLNGMTAGTLTITTGTTNGHETLNIDSSTAASTVADIVMNGTTLTTVNISGDANFTHTASLDANVTTCDASTATGNVNITQNNAGAFAFTGGAGNDTCILGANYGTTDIVNGGAGTDVLGGTTAALGGTTASQTNATNFETLRVSDAHTTALNVSHFGSIGEVVLDVGSNAGTITNASTGIMVTLGTQAGTAAGAGALTTTISGSGTTDTLTCTLNDAEQAGAVTFTGAETVNLVSNLDLDGSAANTGTAGQNTFAGTTILTDTAAQETLVITGTEQMNLTGAVTANRINATGFTQPLIMGAACALTGVTVEGGSGADTLFGSAGNDIINGGAGNDIINSLALNDIVSGGAGADTFRQNNKGANGVDRQTISDFDDTPTTGDVFNFNSGIDTLDGTDNFATSASIQTHSTSGNLTVNAAAEVVVVTSGTTANLLTSGAANVLNGTDLLTAIGGTITLNADGERLFAVADANGDVGIYHGDGTGNTAVINTELTLVAILQGADVTLANLVFQNFSNGA